MFGKRNSITDAIAIAVLIAVVAPILTAQSAVKRRRIRLYPRTIWGWVAILVLFTAAVSVYQHFNAPVVPAKQEIAI